MRYLWLIIFLFSSPVFAFPELVRHDYPHCFSCHVSPTGGGVLTQYGREISKAVLSTWGTDNENEAGFAYNLVTTPDWLDAMGLFRSVYAHQNTPFINQSQYIFMQNDLELAAHYNFVMDTEPRQLDVVASIGYQNREGLSDHAISRRHYVTFQRSENFSLRAGRFFPAFGINTPDHIIPIKKSIGWGESRETYNLEVLWKDVNWESFLTFVFGRIDDPESAKETGFAWSPNVSIKDHYKIGLNSFYGETQYGQRKLYGVWGILGFTHHLFLLSEMDFQQQKNFGTLKTSWGMVNYQRLDYEIETGLHLYITQDYSHIDHDIPNGLRKSFGLGTQFFPRPHFEINFSWQKVKAEAVTSSYTDLAWLMLNFYM